MNKQIQELAADARKQMVVLTTVDDEQWRQHEEFVEKFAALVAAHERKFIAEQWEERYGYDKHGVAEFIRKRANTQEKQK
jgi:tagatose-1,6-bisphosphate aldolase